MGLPEAEKYIAEQEAYQKKTYAPTTEGWTEAPLTKIGELAGGSIPYMAAPLLAGAAAPAAAALGAGTGLATAAGLGASALASAGQFTGSNLLRQTDTGKKLGETDLGAAALAAIPQAALDTVSMKMIPGLGKMFESAGVNLTAKAANDLAKEGIKKTAADYLLATGKTMSVEGLTEAGQQVFERMQVGLALNDPAARAEYFDNFLGGAVLGGILAPAGRYVERGQEQARFDTGAQAKQAEARTAAQAAAQQAATAEEAQAAQAAEATAAQRQTPEYATQAQQDYLAAEQTQADLMAQLKKGTKEAPLLEADEQENAAIQQQLKEHSVALKKTAAEFNATKRFLPAAEEAPTTETGEVAAAAPAPTPDETIAQIEAQIEALQTQAQGAAPAQIIEFGAQHKELKKQIAKIKQVTAAMNKANELGKTDLAAKHAKTLQDLQSQVVMPAAPEVAAAPVAEESAPTEITAPTTAATPKVRKPKAVLPLAPYTGIAEQGLMFPETGAAESVVNVGQGKQPEQSRQALVAEFQAARQTQDRLGAQNAIEKLRVLDERSKARSEAARGLGAPQGELSKMLPEMMGQKLTALAPQAPSQEITSAAKTTATPESLRTQIGALPQNLSPESEQLVGRMMANFNEFTADPERTQLAAGMLHDLRMGAETARSRDVASELDRIEAAKQPAQASVFDEELPVVEGPRQPLPTGLYEEKAGPPKPAPAPTPAPITTLSMREAADNAKRRAENERAARLATIPGESVSFEAHRQALETLDDVSPRLDELVAKAADETLPQPTRNKAKREIKKLSLARKFLESTGEGNGELRLQAEEEMAKLKVKIDKQEKMVGAKPTPSRKQELAKSKRREKELTALIKGFKSRAERAPIETTADKAYAAAEARAERFIQTQKAAETKDEVTPEMEALLEKINDPQASKFEIAQAQKEYNMLATQRLPARKVGPVVRTAQAAGNIRTGEGGEAGIEARRVSPGTKPVQGGTTKAPTPTQAVREANVISAKKAAADKAAAAAAAVAAKKAAAAAKRKATIAAKKETAKLEKALPKSRVASAIEDTYYDEDLGDALYRTKTSEGAGMNEQAVARLADRITSTWKTIPEIIVVATEKGLPEHIQAQARQDKMTGKIPGLYDTETKKVYLVAENLHTGEDVALTVAHEIAGHFGLREMLGGDYKTEMGNIYSGNASVKEQADAKMAANKRLSRDTAVEEVLAEIAETGPTAQQESALRRIYNVIKRALARAFGSKNISDEEVRQVVINARRYVQEGVGGRGGEVAVEKVNYRTANYKSNDALSELAQAAVAQPKTLREKAGSNIALQFEMQTADMRAGVIKALNNAVEDPNTMGSTKLFRQAIFSITAADQNGATTQMSLNTGPPEMFKDSKGYYEVRSSNKNDAGAMFDAVQDIPDSYGNTEAKMGLASVYMIAQRAMNKGLKKLDLGALGVTEEKIAAAMAVVNADPELKSALESIRSKYNAYNRGMIEWLASPQVAAITKADAEAYLKDEDYVPYYRVRADGVAELVFGGEKTLTIGDISHQPYLAELKGGESKIMPLDKSIMRNTMLLVTKGMNNMAMKNVAYAMQAAGQGIGPVDKEGKPTNLMPIHSGKAPADASVIHWTQEPDPNKADDKGDRWLRVQTNDTIFGGVPAELIIKSLEGAHLTLPAFLKWGGIAGDLLRSGVTRTPIYLARQLFRDPFAATATSGLDYNPITAIFKANKEFLKIASGKSETGAKMIEKGLMQSGMFEGDAANMSKIALQLASGKSQGVLDKMFAKADQLALQADAATRSLIYENAIKNGLSEVEASHAVRESMNFSKRGLSPSVQYASRMIPFFNAQIQGLSVLFKAATGNMPANDVLKIKRKFFNNAMMLTGFGVAYAMAMDDDEYYKNAKPRDRYSNFFVPLPGVDEPLKLPIPYEFGFFFSAGVAVADAIKGEVDTPQQLRAIKDMFVGSIPGASSNLAPQIIKPIAEVYANRSFFSGNAIESERLRKLDPEARYNANTTEVAKWMATMVPGLSPIQIEHIVSGYLGQLPLMVVATTNDLFRDGKAEPTRKLSEMPLIGSSFQTKYGGEEADVVYKLATEAAQAKRTFDNFRKTGKIEDAKDYLREHRAEISVAPIAMQYQKFMGTLRTQEEIIRGSNATPEVKAKRIDDLDKQRQLQSERYLKAIRRAEEASGRTTPP
jgi:hypothetical protein